MAISDAPASKAFATASKEHLRQRGVGEEEFDGVWHVSMSMGRRGSVAVSWALGHGLVRDVREIAWSVEIVTKLSEFASLSD